ncbi:tyrosine-type recombinase/integrase [Lysinibacillus antri]|uniref:Integrase n=1 Tax=Lysinibacillus antri TaxID=2498145 RepID=A0A3S0QND5_9BACI|nr:tyrosine-type recombinase/integrase [Lysinibacillus antri]RUL48793.1 integrase [Lysinibacillus antri]
MALFEEYLRHLRLERKATNTVETYRYHLTAFLSWAYNENYDLKNLKPMDLLDFKECLLMQNKSERTVNAIISCLKGYFDYLVLYEVVKTNPITNLLRIKVPHYKQERLTDRQLVHFYAYIDSLRPNARAAFYLMLGSGARVSEVTNLLAEDFKVEGDQLFIDIKNAKWGSNRCIPVVDRKATEVLFNYLSTLDVSSLPAFRVSKRTLQTYATRFSEKTGIPFSCHVLRHTFATLLMEKEIPIEKIQYLLGHKSVSMTRHYTQSAVIDVSNLKMSFLKEEVTS